MLNKIREVPLYSAAFSFLIWLAGTDLLLILIDKLFTFPLALMLGFGFIYPVGATAIFFLLSKRHGVLWYFPAAVILTSSLHMIFWSAYRIMVPNILIMKMSVPLPKNWSSQKNMQDIRFAAIMTLITKTV